MMEGTRFAGVDNVSFVEEVVVSQLVAEETATNVDFFTTNDDNLLAGEDLLRDDGCESAEEVALAIDDDNWLEGRHRNRFLLDVE